MPTRRSQPRTLAIKSGEVSASAMLAVLVLAIALHVAGAGTAVFSGALGLAVLAVGLLRGRRYTIRVPAQTILASGGVKGVLEWGPKAVQVVDDDAALACVGLGVFVALLVLLGELAVHLTRPTAVARGPRVGVRRPRNSRKRGVAKTSSPGAAKGDAARVAGPSAPPQS